MIDHTSLFLINDFDFILHIYMSVSILCVRPGLYSFLVIVLIFVHKNT